MCQLGCHSNVPRESHTSNPSVLHQRCSVHTFTCQVPSHVPWLQNGCMKWHSTALLELLQHISAPVTRSMPHACVPLAAEPNFDTVVECLPQCTGPGHPVRFPPTTSGQHILDKYAETHAGYTGPITA